MPDSKSTEFAPAMLTSPDYVGLAKFLLQPFLDSPESLKVDCEISQRRSRVLIRMAFDGEDKGRVFGRGGRNIQAVRSVLQAIAQMHGFSAYLEIYGSQSSAKENRADEHTTHHRPASRRSSNRHRS